MGRPARLRVLCLHGWRANPDVNRFQVARLRRAFGDAAEFSFLAGPVPVQEPADESVRAISAAPYYEWWPWGAGLAGQEAAVRHVAEHVASQGPFDVLLGFSQGAAAATMFVAAAEAAAGRRGPDVADGIFAKVTPPRLVACVTGVRPEQAAPSADGRATAVRTPSVHVVGWEDSMWEESTGLAHEWYRGGKSAFDALEELECARAACRDSTPTGRRPRRHRLLAEEETTPHSLPGQVAVVFHDRGHEFPADPAPLAEAITGQLRRAEMLDSFRGRSPLMRSFLQHGG